MDLTQRLCLLSALPALSTIPTVAHSRFASFRILYLLLQTPYTNIATANTLLLLKTPVRILDCGRPQAQRVRRVHSAKPPHDPVLPRSGCPKCDALKRLLFMLQQDLGLNTAELTLTSTHQSLSLRFSSEYIA